MAAAAVKGRPKQPLKKDCPAANVTVKDCMVWPTKEDQNGKVPDKGKGKKVEINKSNAAAAKDSNKKKTIGGANGRKEGTKKKQETAGDPWIGDLISHRFHKEYTEQLKEEREKEEKKKQKKAFKDKESKELIKKTVNIKANKAAQLRSIALADKVEVNATELWQMQKFKDAKPHLSTQGKKSEAREMRDEAAPKSFAGKFEENKEGVNDEEFLSAQNDAEYENDQQREYYKDDESDEELFYDPHANDYRNDATNDDYTGNYDDNNTFNNFTVMAL